MKNYIASNRNKVVRALFVLGLITSPAAYANQHEDNENKTQVNKAHKSYQSDKPTAERQGRTSSEAELTRKIRDAIMNDPSLSMTAKNVTVVTQGQMVTLRGTVKSQAERTRLDQIAKENGGSANIVNDTTVQ